MSKFDIGDIVQWYEFVDPTGPHQPSPHAYDNTIATTPEECYNGLSYVKDYTWFNSPIKTREDTKDYIIKKFGMISDVRQQMIRKSIVYDKDGNQKCSFGGTRHATNCSCVIPEIYTILNYEYGSEDIVFEDDLTLFTME